MTKNSISPIVHESCDVGDTPPGAQWAGHSPSHLSLANSNNNCLKTPKTTTTTTTTAAAAAAANNDNIKNDDDN